MRKVSPAFFIAGFLIGLFPIVELGFSTPPGAIPKIEYVRSQSVWGSTGSTTVVDTDPDAAVDPDVVTGVLEGAFDQVGAYAQMVSTGLVVGLFSLVRGRAGAGLGWLGASIVLTSLNAMTRLVELRAEDVYRWADGTLQLSRGIGYWGLLLVGYGVAAWSLVRFIRLSRQLRRNREAGETAPLLEP